MPDIDENVPIDPIRTGPPGSTPHRRGWREGDPEAAPPGAEDGAGGQKTDGPNGPSGPQGSGGVS